MTYAAIKQRFLNSINRQDISDDQVALYINLGKVRIEREVRLSCMLNHYVVAVGQAFNTLDIPDDHLQTREIVWTRPDATTPGCVAMSRELANAGDGYGRILALRQLNHLPTYYGQLDSSHWLLAGNPAPGDEIVVSYYGSFPELVNDADTSALTEILGDALVYAALAYCSLDLRSDDMQLFETAYQQTVTDLMEQERKEQFRGQLAVNVPYWGY